MYYVYILSIGTVQYVGMSKNFIKRFKYHRKLLRKGKHHCTVLQEHFNTLQYENFGISVKRTYTVKTDALAYEQFLIKTTDCVNTARDTNHIHINADTVGNSVTINNTNIPASPLPKPVKCSNGLTFESVTKCAKHFGCKSSVITDICNGRKRDYKGLTFTFL